ncbi:sulfide:quinone oxidoreductase, mitochondrial [Papilio machaon]|uniref:sulfide:quinone oxidoreductase, mitochondrial n=1 Tax=Papilio machaon TaxID=76193 RepID=UPI001E6650D3|nr:sulfide:quinone oxidoreductase, mitochondrial [Papilio machaon]
MNNFILRLQNTKIISTSIRSLSLSASLNKNYSCKLLVVGGGSGGCTIAAKFAKRLKKDSVIVLEPSTKHYYQPLFTLVGAGVKPVSATCRSEKSVLPAAAKWIRDSAQSIDADNCHVTTVNGDVINYEYIVIAVGLNNDYSKVPGLREALQDENSGVSTIFDAAYCEKTWRDMQRFKGGNAIFTYPNSPIKCPGAPQKIAYLADSYFNKVNVRSKANIVYNTCLPVIFGVKKYADVLLKVVERKNIQVNYKTVLKQLDHTKREAVFYCTEDTTKELTMPYDMLHVAPPMRTPDFLSNSPGIVDSAGFLTVDKYTLQHEKYPNMYGIGDCTNTPNSKTAAAIAKQSYVLEHNLLQTMKRDQPTEQYNGYGACPLVTSYHTCIIAEFLYDGVPRETLRRCKVVIVGGGAGGCSIAWRLARLLRGKDIIVLEPSEVHFYQPMFSLVGAGIKPYSDSHRPVQTLLPEDVIWLKDHAEGFDPSLNVVHTRWGKKVHYEFMVLAVGLKNDYDKIPGLVKALDDPESCVNSTYSAQYCEKTWRCVRSFGGGHALFTFPRQVGKCSGAALKIMFLSDDYWRRQKLEERTNITFVTGSNVLFGVQKYSAALNKITADKNIAVNRSLDLMELNKTGATFITDNGQCITLPYNFLHVTPPMSPPNCLTASPQLIADEGYLNVDKYTLQHKLYPNIYGVGDCINTTNSKTAAAVARQSYVVARNLLKTMEGKPPVVKYEGYGACPVMTSYVRGILAESVYDKKPCETFPFDQSNEHKLIGFLTKTYLPYLYWNKLIKGKWNGPLTLRKIINPLRK